jgi:hypothetical protein
MRSRSLVLASLDPLTPYDLQLLSGGVGYLDFGVAGGGRAAIHVETGTGTARPRPCGVPSCEFTEHAPGVARSLWSSPDPTFGV